MRITKTFWFTESKGTRPIGIVIGVGAVGERKAYIGTGNGYSEPEDAQSIAENGAKLTIGMTEEILKELKGQ